MTIGSNVNLYIMLIKNRNKILLQQQQYKTFKVLVVLLLVSLPLTVLQYNGCFYIEFTSHVPFAYIVSVL